MQRLCGWGGGGAEEEVELGVGDAITSEVMVGRMASIDTEEVVPHKEGSQEGSPQLVLRVNVEVASEKDGGANRFDSLGSDGFEGSDGRVKLYISTSSGEIDANVDGGDEARDGKVDGEDSRGGGGEDGDEGVDGGVPQDHGAAVRPPGGELQVRGEGVLSIEMVAVGGRDGGEDGSNIAGEGLWLAEEDQERMVGGEEMGQGTGIPL